MTVEIKHRHTGAVLYTHDGEGMGAAVLAALRAGADLGGAYLRGADLGGADLGGADLGGADLGGADLRGADLRGAVLGGADLGGADLGGAYLGSAYLGGAVECPVGDPRGYRLIAVLQGDGEWLLTAGCRGPWTVDECRAHWGDDGYEGDRLVARRYLRALDWWESEAEDYRAAATRDSGEGEA